MLLLQQQPQMSSSPFQNNQNKNKHRSLHKTEKSLEKAKQSNQRFHFEKQKYFASKNQKQQQTIEILSPKNYTVNHPTSRSEYRLKSSLTKLNSLHQLHNRHHKATSHSIFKKAHQVQKNQTFIQKTKKNQKQRSKSEKMIFEIDKTNALSSINGSKISKLQTKLNKQMPKQVDKSSKHFFVENKSSSKIKNKMKYNTISYDSQSGSSYENNTQIQGQKRKRYKGENKHEAMNAKKKAKDVDDRSQKKTIKAIKYRNEQSDFASDYSSIESKSRDLKKAQRSSQQLKKKFKKKKQMKQIKNEQRQKDQKNLLIHIEEALSFKQKDHISIQQYPNQVQLNSIQRLQMKRQHNPNISTQITHQIVDHLNQNIENKLIKNKQTEKSDPLLKKCQRQQILKENSNFKKINEKIKKRTNSQQKYQESLDIQEIILEEKKMIDINHIQVLHSNNQKIHKKQEQSSSHSKQAQSSPKNIQQIKNVTKKKEDSTQISDTKKKLKKITQLTIYYQQIGELPSFFSLNSKYFKMTPESQNLMKSPLNWHLLVLKTFKYCYSIFSLFQKVYSFTSKIIMINQQELQQFLKDNLLMKEMLNKIVKSTKKANKMNQEEQIILENQQYLKELSDPLILNHIANIYLNISDVDPKPIFVIYLNKLRQLIYLEVRRFILALKINVILNDQSQYSLIYQEAMLKVMNCCQIIYRLHLLETTKQKVELIPADKDHFQELYDYITNILKNDVLIRNQK